MKELRCAPPGLPATVVQIGSDRHDLEAAIAAQRSFVIADRTVLERYPLTLPDDARLLEIDGGETCKTLAGLEPILRAAAAHRFDRRSTFVVIGGGSIGDLGGLAASLFLRGVRLLQVPTTLLAMLDSSVGGKTAINLPEGKNLVGTLWPAQRVLMDPAYLGTLSDTEFRSGLGEALKAAIGLSAELFTLLEERSTTILNRDPTALTEMLELAVLAKIRIVEADAREEGPRRLLNLGHTLGHAIEAHSPGTTPHGLAVARGTHFALELARDLGDLEAPAAERCTRLLTTYGFEAHALPPADELMPFLRRDKKVEGDAVHMVLPTAVGESRTRLMSLAEVGARLR